MHWLERFLGATTDSRLERVLGAAGDIGAVWFVRLGDGRELAVKALHPGARLPRARLIARLVSELARGGFPCADVVVPPIEFDGVVAFAEEYKPVGSRLRNAHLDSVAPAMAAALQRQVRMLRSAPGYELTDGQPAWADWSAGPWPPPHDPVFVFDSLPASYAWLDDAATESANILRQESDAPVAIGHSDWVFQNVALTRSGLAAAYDWDSLIWAPEPAVVGLAAGAQHRNQALAAARWVRCYNARCQLDNLVRRHVQPPSGSFLEQLRIELG